MPKQTKKNKRTKSPAKKTAVTKKAKKAKKDSVCSKKCLPEHSFWVNNGPVVDTICKLKSAIKLMNAEQYKFHTQTHGNDFERWIHDCVGDKKMAALVGRAKTKSATLKALYTKCCK